MTLDDRPMTTLARSNSITNALGLELGGEENIDLRAIKEAAPTLDNNPYASPISFRSPPVSSKSSPQFEFTVRNELEPEDVREEGSDRGKNISVVDSDKPERWERYVQELRRRAHQEKERRKLLSRFPNTGIDEEGSKFAEASEKVQKAYNGLAGRILFNNLNPHYYRFVTEGTISSDQQPMSPRQNLIEIDLHRLNVEEALDIVNQHIVMCQITGVKKTELICGKGNHSKGGTSILKPSLLEKLANNPGIKINEHEHNPGRLVLHILDENPLSTVVRWNALEPISIDERAINARDD